MLKSWFIITSKSYLLWCIALEFSTESGFPLYMTVSELLNIFRLIEINVNNSQAQMFLSIFHASFIPKDTDEYKMCLLCERYDPCCTDVSQTVLLY